MDPNETDDGSKTALFYTGPPECTQILVDKFGVGIRAKDLGGRSALASNDQLDFESTRYLAEKGADMVEFDAEG